MSAFRLTQITDTHLSPRFPIVVDNFNRAAQYIADNPPDLIIHTGDVAFDGPEHPEDLRYARAAHDALLTECRYIPGNHDIGDNPTEVGAPLVERVTEANRQEFVSAFETDRWRFDAAGWCFIGLNSLVMNSGLDCEAEQFDWLGMQLSALHGQRLALFIHKPLYKDAPDDPELAETSFRYVPMPARRKLVEMLDAVDLGLVACGHVHQRRDYTFRNVRHIWAPSSSFLIRSDTRQEPIGIKEVGLVEYTFQPDNFEVRHVRIPGLAELDIEAVLENESDATIP
jgi:3',5'-cyclic AMP phosphodiesterase CpdA